MVHRINRQTPLNEFAAPPSILTLNFSRRDFSGAINKGIFPVLIPGFRLPALLKLAAPSVSTLNGGKVKIYNIIPNHN